MKQDQVDRLCAVMVYGCFKHKMKQCFIIVIIKRVFYEQQILLYFWKY